jgi:hypothetical protein
MHGKLCRRQGENQPSAPGIDVRKLEHVIQEGAVSLSIRAVDDRMRTSDHLQRPFQSCQSNSCHAVCQVILASFLRMQLL